LSGPPPHPTAFGRQEGHRRLRGLSADNYISISKTSRATATRDLQDLVEKGALIKIGELRHTRYFLNIDERSES
jgi:Fic family protein